MEGSDVEGIIPRHFQLMRAIILGCRGLRSLGVGVLIVALPLALERRGLGTGMIAMVLAAGLAGATVQMLLAPRLSLVLGRRGGLALSTFAMALTVGALATTDNVVMLAIACFVGAVSLQPNISVQAPLEHAALASGCKCPTERSFVFAWYNGISTLALAAGSFFTGLTQLGGPSEQIIVTAAILGFASLAYLARLPVVISPGSDQKEALLTKDDLPLAKCQHRRRILCMTALFAVDSFAGGLCLNSLVIHWLSLTYSLREHVLGPLFAVSGVITTPSLWAAAWMGKHIGLINTMVFTHLPSNVCLILMPLAPSVELVYALILVRAALSQMDVPARESFIMSVVSDEERVACSSCVTAGRALACIAGPPVCAFLWHSCGPGVPLMMAGGLKCAYDLTLLATFRATQAAS